MATIKAEIAVLYRDLEIVRVPWAERCTLDTCDVEAIAVIGEQWRQCSISHDYYQLIWTDSDCCLTGHDGDYGFYSLNGSKVEWRVPFILPENCIEFQSVYISKQGWQKALAIYADPDGGMF